MAVEFGTVKTVVILTIVVGCFAVLWPKLFYPMIQASVNTHNPLDGSQACCDVIFENDVKAIKIMTEMCGNILHQYDDIDPKLTQAFQQGKLSKEVVDTCRSEVLNKCGIDITAFLIEKVRLGKTYRQILDEVRSFNSSVCLKLNFGVTPGALGAPRMMRLGALVMPSHHRQERPPHLRPDLLHPALREKGRAIPQSHIVPRTVEKEGRPGPIPGMRPPMGGAGHVVPAPKGSGTMGIVMPIYTIGIVVFFMYTIMKMIFKKSSDTTSSLGEFSPDPEFRKVVFNEPYVDEKPPLYEENLRQRSKRETSPAWKATEDNGTKLVVTAISGLLAEVDLHREILAKRAESERKGENDICERIEEIPTVEPTISEKGETDICERIEEIPTAEPTIPEKGENDICEGIEQLPAAEPTLPEKTDDEISEKYQESVPAQQQSSIPSEPVKQVEPSDSVEPLKLVDQAGHPAIQHHIEPSEEQDGGAKVKVLGMEMTASCEGGQRWSRPGTPILGAIRSRPGTPILGAAAHSRSITPVPPPTPEPQAIFLEGALPSQSQLLVSDSETQALTMDGDDLDDTDAPIILSGKMTLSLISLDAALAAEDEQQRRREKEAAVMEESRKQSEAENVPKDDLVQAVRVELGDEEEEDDEEECEEEEVEEEEEEDEEDINDEEKPDVRLVNDIQHANDDAPSTTNYTTASAAAEATNATGPEETAADFSALESFGPDDEQQDELDDEEGVWNGDVNSGEEEESEEEEAQQPQGIPQNNQQHQR